MGKLLKKELRLALHPTALIFLLLSSMLMIPNYPYLVIFFYTELAVFFTCMTGRENHDIDFTMLLPVAKHDVVRARMLLVVLLEIAQLVVAVPFAILRQLVIPMPNAAGMDANVALMALALVQMGLFNAVYFRMYYKNVRRVGISFLCGSAVTFLFICVAEVSAHTVPFVRDVLDTPDPTNMGPKLLMLLIGVGLFVVMTWLTCRSAEKSFEKQDL